MPNEIHTPTAARTGQRGRADQDPSPKSAVTLGWRLEDITTTAGQAYTGPTSGTVTFLANGFVTSVCVPLVRDEVSQPNFMTCTNRPPTQRWHLQEFCVSMRGGSIRNGNIVTATTRQL